eukprot:CAMPEP_0206518338 /NCGR_PEP_ID=MMETSP0324_2-20121206/64520_1 /ASSEMBLY_ACC=CAM_ASM_000836 /TAXON_ID=2866 /ORGANISM="Crypthecodinium cohnii, Strain Seligo" /LENGTH=84 /DNA_ID=CAMNT_0054011677 /DNA_START=216 /DNA_END=470 /DNA_ORIENTATION=-
MMCWAAPGNSLEVIRSAAASIPLDAGRPTHDWRHKRPGTSPHVGFEACCSSNKASGGASFESVFTGASWSPPTRDTTPLDSLKF